MKTIHIQLPDKRRDIGVFKVLPAIRLVHLSLVRSQGWTYASTLENSLEGDITKLSLEFDQDIRCCILGSSSILRRISQTLTSNEA